MDSGAALAFARGNQALMILRSLDSFAVQNGKDEILWRATANLDLGDVSIGKSVRSLRDAEYIEVTFGQLKPGAIIKTGNLIVTLNAAVRLQAAIPAQTVNEQKVLFVRDLDQIKKVFDDRPAVFLPRWFRRRELWKLRPVIEESGRSPVPNLERPPRPLLLRQRRAGTLELFRERLPASQSEPSFGRSQDSSVSSIGVIRPEARTAVQPWLPLPSAGHPHSRTRFSPFVFSSL